MPRVCDRELLFCVFFCFIFWLIHIFVAMHFDKWRGWHGVKIYKINGFLTHYYAFECSSIDMKLGALVLYTEAIKLCLFPERSIWSEFWAWNGVDDWFQRKTCIRAAGDANTLMEIKNTFLIKKNNLEGRSDQDLWLHCAFDEIFVSFFFLRVSDVSENV